LLIFCNHSNPPCMRTDKAG